jgi:hypothetical protein
MRTRIIQLRPSRDQQWKKQGGWEVFEAEGVCPVHCGENARQNALDYAEQRASSGRCDIQVFDDAWNVIKMITKADLKAIF